MHFCVFGILSSLWCDSEHYLYLACMTFWKTTLSAFFSFNISVIFWSRKHDVLSCFCCVPLFAPPLCPWDSPGKNTGVGYHALLQGIFLTQGLNPHLLWLLHCRQILYCLATGKAQETWRACVLSRFSLVRLCATLWTVAHQAPLSMRFSNHVY